MIIWDMRRTYLNLRRLRQILTVLVKHGFSHVIERMHITDHLPWVGSLIKRNAPSLSLELDLPSRLAAAFEDLGPVYVKLGQMLAMRPDLVPVDFQNAFSRLQDKVPAVPGDEIVPFAEASLGKPLEQVFRDFNRVAIAAGSIGQVHEATLMNGCPVIVKIKRPGIEQIIPDDTNLIDALAELVDKHIPELAVIRPKMLAGELRRTIYNELDFVGEAAYASKFRTALQDQPGLHIPKIYWNHVTKDILVMEKIDGKGLTDLHFLPRQEKCRIANVVAESFMRQYFETGLFHGDPHQGNILYQPDGVISLIDFGQTGHISEDMRFTLCRMLMALKDGDTDRMVDLYSQIGEFAPDANIQGFRFDFTNFVDRNYGMPANRIDFSDMAQESLSIARRNGLYLPRDFALLLKSLMLVAGVIRELDPSFMLNSVVETAVRRLAKQMYRPDALAKRGIGNLGRFADLLKRMPDDVRDLMDKARDGRFTINFHHDNLQPIAERAGRALDRLSLGIIAAAVIIASSIVLSAGASGSLSGYVIPLFGGVSVPVMLASAGFLVALFVAAYVAWGIFRDKR